MLRNKYNQGKCLECAGWHFKLQLSESRDIETATCCRCGAIYSVSAGKVIEITQNGKYSKPKEEKA